MKAFSIALVALALISVSVVQISSVSAHPHGNMLEYIKFGDGIAVEQVQISLSVPEGNTQPWGYVKGIVNNPVEGYPVIIQISNEDNEAARVAQVDVAQDGTYEYIFRIYSNDNGNIVRQFEGDYNVTISKVVHINESELKAA